VTPGILDRQDSAARQGVERKLLRGFSEFIVTGLAKVVGLSGSGFGWGSWIGLWRGMGAVGI
jgi:hypothetical protein